MTSHQVQLIRLSFRSVPPLADQVAALFYARLFELDPSLRPLFHGELRQQGRKLVEMLAFTLEQLEHPEPLQATLRELGARHVTYGVKDGHYQTVGEALLWTIQQVLGTGFSADVRAAWTEWYRFVADAMRGQHAGHQAA